MATANASLQYDNTSNANFRAWGSGLSALFPTGGFWTPAADTGQINWATVTAPAANTFAGYEIWKSNDALSASFTIYMKVEYGSNNNGTLGSRVRFSFGTGTNGAGTLTGSTLGTYDDNSNTAGTGATMYNFFCSGGAGYFSIQMWVAATISCGFVIERSLDSSGSYTSTYCTVCAFSTGTSFVQQTLFKIGSGTTTPSQTNAHTLFLAGSSAAVGSFAEPFPVFPYLGYPDNPMTAIMGMKTGDQTEGATFTVTMYGTTRTYLYSKTTNIQLGTSIASMGVGIRYE